MRISNEMTNEEIVFRLQDTFDDEGFEILVSRFRYFSYKLSDSYEIEGYEPDDFIQDFNIVLYDSVHSYEWNNNYFFASYFSRCIHNHFINLIRRRKAQKRSDGKRVCYLHDVVLKDEDGLELIDCLYDEFAPSSQDVMEIKEINNTYFSWLSDLEKGVFKLYLEGQSVKDIVETLDLDVVQVRSAITRCRAKMRKAYYKP